MITKRLKDEDYLLAVTEGTMREEWSIKNGLRDTPDIAKARKNGSLPLTSLEANIAASKVEVATARFLKTEFVPRNGLYTAESSSIADIESHGRFIDCKNKVGLKPRWFSQPQDIGDYWSPQKDKKSNAIVVFGHAAETEVTLYGFVDTVPFRGGTQNKIKIDRKHMMPIEDLIPYLGMMEAWLRPAA